MQRKKINEARMDETWNQRGEGKSPVADETQAECI